MFWDKKDKKGLPELPPIRINSTKPEIQSPRLAPPPEDEEMPEEKNKLPSFPDSPSYKGFAQAAIKEAINENPQFPPEKPKRIEMEEWKPAQEPTGFEFPQEAQRIQKKSIKTETQREEKKEIFVKLDRFRSAKKGMELLSKNIEEMEDLIRKIRETKMREEQEFTNWEKNVESVRARIDNIRQDIFEKLD